MPLPRVLRGAAAIGKRLEISAAAAERLHRQGLIPTFRAGGTPYATEGALDEWRPPSWAGRRPAGSVATRRRSIRISPPVCVQGNTFNLRACQIRHIVLA